MGKMKNEYVVLVEWH